MLFVGIRTPYKLSITTKEGIQWPVFTNGVFNYQSPCLVASDQSTHTTLAVHEELHRRIDKITLGNHETTSRVFGPVVFQCFNRRDLQDGNGGIFRQTKKYNLWINDNKYNTHLWVRLGFVFTSSNYIPIQNPFKKTKKRQACRWRWCPGELHRVIRVLCGHKGVNRIRPYHGTCPIKIHQPDTFWVDLLSKMCCFNFCGWFWVMWSFKIGKWRLLFILEASTSGIYRL